ncbi:hypothetical protein [Nocardioides aequoreus]|uniref:hypothetical protein n=1 Tax=Nocardioides aequoreus TaxID=397278 RepID=UPI0004C387A7|nr:hypothetical protein [Nocardioides aequoreus]
MDHTLDSLGLRVLRARQLRQERDLAAQRCGCGRRCARCRTAVDAATRSLVNALTALDSAIDAWEDERLPSGAA